MQSFLKSHLSSCLSSKALNRRDRRNRRLCKTYTRIGVSDILKTYNLLNADMESVGIRGLP